MDVYPLIFEPIFKQRIWGGRNLETCVGKTLPVGASIGESWEIADLEDDQSVVRDGPARGQTLGALVNDWGTDLFGRAPLFESRFPLLIKFLDATDTLSVQVHPDEAMAARLGGRVRIKNEAWYIIEAEDDGCIYRGVREGVDARALRQAIDDGTVESLLIRIPVRKGHCYYLPSGTIHALGKGVTVAEVQTPSDITYRVFDWNRVDGSTGSPRELHIDLAMECISFNTGSIEEERVQHLAGMWTAITSLVRCPSFVIERVRMAEGVEQPIPHKEMVIWIVLEGRGHVTHDGSTDPVAFQRGDTVLLPAGLKSPHVLAEESCMWLEVTVPVRSSLAKFQRADTASLREPTTHAGAFVPLNVSKEPPPQE